MYGSSAGAINATYFLSGQREGVRIYYEDIANKQFVDLSRLLDRKNEQGQSRPEVWLLMLPSCTQWQLRYLRMNACYACQLAR